MEIRKDNDFIGELLFTHLKNCVSRKRRLSEEHIYFTYQTSTKENVTGLVESIEPIGNNEIKINFQYPPSFILLTGKLCETNVDRVQKIFDILHKNDEIDRVNSFQKVALNEWINTHEISPCMRYKEAAEKMLAFFQRIELGHYCFECSVVSEHVSKSITLPVLLLQRGKTKIYIRDNFYNYKVTIESDVKLDIPTQLISNNEDISTLYCEGFSPNWVYPTYQKNNSSNFTIEVLNYECFLETIITLVERQMKSDEITD